MKRIKFSGTLSLDKKTIAQLTDAQLDSIQGGRHDCTCSCPASNTCCCDSCVQCPTK